MKIGDVMSREVAWCGPRVAAAEAARIMWERDCGCVPVLDDRRIPVGVVTDRDLCIAAYTRGRTLHDMSVESIMSQGVVTCRTDAAVADVEHMMAARKVRRVVVVDDAGRLEGVVSLGDLARARARTRLDRTMEHVFADVARTLAAISQPGPVESESIRA